MTEEEAKTKWCPMARAATHFGPNTISANNVGGPITRCIGSECMMWRHIIGDIMDETRHGYCGLAGKL